MNRTFSIYKERGITMAIMVIVTLLCIYASLYIQAGIGLALGLVPFILIFTYICIQYQYVSLILLAIVNYFLMGFGRYVTLPFPVSITFDIIFGLIFFTTMLRNLEFKHNTRNVFNLYFAFMVIWFLYCFINVGNHATGTIHFAAWLGNIRVISLYPILLSVVIAISAKNYKFIHAFLMLWGILALLAAAKAYCQKNYGFDAAEWAWVSTRGAKTHLLSTGIRYFSFFTDAANFGCGMGFTMVVFSVASIYTSHKIQKIFYLIVAMATGYGLLVSGTRAALAVPIAGFALFIFICKSWKISVASLSALVLGIFFLAFTNIGNGNRLIRRMRSAFNSNEASMNVRFENQKALKAYMSEIPFGIGLGVDAEEVPPQNKFYFVATCPPDSELVYIWIHLGQVGLIVYLVIQVIMYICACCILVFRVRNPEIRGPLTAMLCGTAGMLVASYANQIYFQFPNGPLIYTCLTLVFLAPYFDKQYSEKHGIQHT